MRAVLSFALGEEMGIFRAYRALLKLGCLLACAHSQPPPLHPFLPARISVPPPWHALPLSQFDLGLLFSNATPFSYSQSLLMVPPAGASSSLRVQASFGPYFAVQPLPSPILPQSPPLSASLLSKTVERVRQGERGQKFSVRVLFHWRGDVSRGRCVTLHAFKETEEQRASCLTQAPLGLCVISMSLPKAWFAAEVRGSRILGKEARKLRYLPRRRPRHQGNQPWDRLSTARGKPSHSMDHIQLYYSSSTSLATTLLPPGCMEEELHHSQRRLYYIGAVTLPDMAITKNKSTGDSRCSSEQEGEELWLDPNVMIGYLRGPVRAGRPIAVSVSVRSNFTGDFLVVRLRVKKGLISLLAWPSTASDVWSVSVERTMVSRHEIISVSCLRRGGQKAKLRPFILHQVACFSVDGLEKSFGVAMTVVGLWWVEYSGRSNTLPPQGGAVSRFSFTDREIMGITPLTETNTIINTAILNSQPVSLPVLVLAIGHDERVYDVTAAVTCHSVNEDIVKVSSDCSTLFVDGSESGVGSTCVWVEYHLGTLSGAHCLSVWAPVVPLLVSLSDPVLNAIEGWTRYSQGQCSPVYQRSAIQVLAQFAAESCVETGQLTYMLGSSDWFMDVTELVRDWLKVENPRVAELDERSYLIGREPGVTSLQVESNQWNGVLGSCVVTVTANQVMSGDLSVQLVGGLSLSVSANPSHPSVITATATAHNILRDYGQEAALSIWLQFSDDTATLVSALDSTLFSLRLSSLAETVVMVTPGTQRVVARGEGGGPLLRAELLVFPCQPMNVSAELQAANETGDVGTGGAKRLAGGSGWVRVNLDWELRPDGSEDPGFEVLEVSEAFAESVEREIYELSNSSHPYSVDGKEDDSNNDDDDEGGRNSSPGLQIQSHLERAVLNPSHDVGGVQLRPGREKGSVGEREGEQGDEAGAVFSLLCLSALLFLVNLIPCALRERGQRRREDGDQGTEEEGWREKARNRRK
ncbi:hypothetical protein GJAV_G00248850 [Gymnothorax javanicus]|nr:hypothetical protein GJAV_G00248850 [Gymnothorax javanicus]